MGKKWMNRMFFFFNQVLINQAKLEKLGTNGEKDLSDLKVGR